MILAEIDSSALGGGKSQRMLECTGMLPCVDRLSPLAAQKTFGLADRTAFSGRNSRKHGLDGTSMCPMEKLWWGESDLYSALARLLCLEANGGERQLRRDGLPASSTVKLLGHSK